MSTLRTNAIQTLAGKPILNSTGSILQVVQFNSPATTGEIATTSSTPVSTGLSVSITPISASSKLFVLVTANIKFISGSGDDGIALVLRRDGANVRPAGQDTLFYRADANGNNHHTQASFQHLVNANSTSTTTFTLFFYDAWGGTAVINRDWGSPALTVMEISG
jgi:hypothetical protein